MAIMNNALLDERAKKFSYYFGLELKGAIAAQGCSQAKVADSLGHARSSMSNWLKAKPPIPVDVAQKICEYIGVEMRVIVQRANMRVIEELGPWPPVTINIHDDDANAVAEMLQQASDPVKYGLAALHDPNKEIEALGDAGPDWDDPA